MSNRYTAHEHQRMKLAGWLDPDEAEKLRAGVVELGSALKHERNTNSAVMTQLKLVINSLAKEDADRMALAFSAIDGIEHEPWIPPAEAAALRARVKELACERDSLRIVAETTTNQLKGHLTALENERDQLRSALTECVTLLECPIVEGDRIASALATAKPLVINDALNPTPHDATERQKE